MHVANTPLCTPPPAVQVRSGRSVTVTVDCTYPDDETGPLQYEIGTQPAKGTLNPSGTTFNNFRTYTAGAGADGADQFTIRLTGSTGSSPFVTQQITTGSAINHAPVCDDTNFGFRQTVYSGRPAALFPFCSDADGDQVSYAAGAHPAHGTSSASNGELSYTADTGYVGFDDVPYTASDGHGGSDSGSYPVDVQAPAAAHVQPGSDHGHRAARQDRAAAALLLQPAERSADVLPHRRVQGHAGQLQLVRPRRLHRERGRDRDRHVHDERDERGRRQRPAVPVTITIDPDFNRAPTCSSNSFNPKRVVTATASTLDFAGFCSDPDGDPLVYVRKSDPAHGTVTAGPSPTLSYTSAAGFTGPDNFTFAARDDRGVESPVATHYLDVVASLAPSCTPNPAVTLRPSQARSLSFNCSDPDSRQITYKIVSPPNGTLSPPGDSTSAVPHLHGARHRHDRQLHLQGDERRRRERDLHAVVHARPEPQRQPELHRELGLPDRRPRRPLDAGVDLHLVLGRRQRRAELHPHRAGAAARHGDRGQRRHHLHPGGGLHRAGLVRLHRQRRARRHDHEHVLGQRRHPARADLRRAERDQRAPRARRARCSSTASTTSAIR